MIHRKARDSMDNTEAIKVLDDMKVKIRIPNAAKTQNKRNEAIDMAKKALAIPSAEPKRVLYIGDGYYNGEMVYDMAECPSCGEKYEDDEPAWKYAKFCMKCGQAISWEMEWEAEGEEE